MAAIITPTDVPPRALEDTDSPNFGANEARFAPLASNIRKRGPTMSTVTGSGWDGGVLLPRSCPVCGRVGTSPCAACVGRLQRAPALPPPLGVDRCAALLLYDGAGRELVARLKYRNARSSLRWLGDAMASLIDARAVDVV